MKTFLIFAINLLVVGFNVHVSEGAVPPKPGFYSLRVPCNTPATVAALVKDKYNEKLVYSGLSQFGVMKFYTNEAKRTFSVSVEGAELACLVTFGNFLMKEAQGTSL